MRDLEAINEEDFVEEDLQVPVSRDGEEIDETECKSPPGVSGVSTISETEPDVDYDTDLEMDDPDSWLSFSHFISSVS